MGSLCLALPEPQVRLGWTGSPHLPLSGVFGNSEPPLGKLSYFWKVWDPLLSEARGFRGCVAVLNPKYPAWKGSFCHPKSPARPRAPGLRPQNSSRIRLGGAGPSSGSGKALGFLPAPGCSGCCLPPSQQPVFPWRDAILGGRRERGQPGGVLGSAWVG